MDIVETIRQITERKRTLGIHPDHALELRDICPAARRLKEIDPAARGDISVWSLLIAAESAGLIKRHNTLNDTGWSVVEANVAE